MLSIRDKDVVCVVSYKKVRAVYFKIKPDGLLYVSCPLKYKKNLKEILLTKSDWIFHHMNLIEHKKKLIISDTVFYLGNHLPLEIQTIVKGKQNIAVESSGLTLFIKDPEKKNYWLDHFLKLHTTEYIKKILPEWIKKTGQIPNQIRFRKMKKWGACTKKGILLFNSYLICLPPPLIHYIVCHELSHLINFDHSLKFKKTLALFLPNAKKLEKELKMYVR